VCAASLDRQAGVVLYWGIVPPYMPVAIYIGQHISEICLLYILYVFC
jgi:hypothetical protein